MGTSGVSKNSPPVRCQKCRDRGHVPGPNGVVRCECLLGEMSRASLLSSGISETIASMPISEIEKPIHAKMREFLSETTPGDLWVIAPRISEIRERVLAYAVRRSGASASGGLSLSRLIDSRFDRDDKAVVDKIVGSEGVLIFRIDDVGDHKKIPSVIEEVIGVRSGARARTIYVSSVSIVNHSGRYGPHACRFFGEFKRSIALKSGLVVRFRAFK